MFKYLSRIKRSLVVVLAGLVLYVQVTGPVLAQPVGQNRPAVTQQAFPAEAAKVHVILLVYDKIVKDRDGKEQGKNFALACQKDIRAFRSILEEGFGAKKDRLVWHDFTGKNPATDKPWTPEEVVKYLRNLRLGANESVVVFHSGHGAFANPLLVDRSHYVEINSGGIYRATLRDLLKCKNPRALILLTDCCSKFNPTPEMIKQMFRAAAVNGQSVQNLFLRVAGVIDITAAENGTCGVANYSGSNPANAGSAFTVALLRLMYDADKTYTGWKDFFPTLREETVRASSNLREPSHRARAFILDEKTPAPVQAPALP